MSILQQKAEHLVMAKERKAVLETQLAEVNKLIDRLSKEDLVELMEELGLEKARIEGIGSIRLDSDVYASISAGMKHPAMNWLVENKFGDLIQETVNSSTLRAWVKEQLKKGTYLPEDLFKVTPFQIVRITKN